MKFLRSKMKRGGPLALGVILLFSSLITIIGQQIVSAQSTSQDTNVIIYQDKVAVKFRGDIYIDENPYDNYREWKRGPAGCQDTIRDTNDGNDQENLAKVTLKDPTAAAGGCAVIEEIPEVPMTNTPAKDINGYRRSDNKIFLPIGIDNDEYGCGDGFDIQFFVVKSGDRENGRGRFYKRLPPEDRPDGPLNEYLLMQGSEDSNLDPDTVVKTSGQTKAGVTVGAFPCSVGEPDRTFSDIITLSSGAVPEFYGLSDPNSANGQLAAGVGDSGDGDQNATCETGGFSLNWILCPIFNGVADFTDWLFDTIVEPFLYTAPISTDPSDPSYQAWSSFRVYANIALILGMLVIVIGQMVGGGLVDAYTAKKVLPKLLLAAILINLSIYIINFLVDITNVIGNGIGNLLFAPFSELGVSKFIPSGANQITAAVGTGLALVAGGTGIAGFLGALLFGGFGSVAVFIGLAIIIPAMIAVLGVFVVLVIRKGLLLLLVISSPIAFILYALPNGEKYFKQWWDILIKTLMMYPIIVIIFTMADILSVTIIRASQNASGVEEGIAGIIAFVLQFLPLFLVPFAFKFAGAAMGGIYAAVSSGGKKASEYTKSRRELAKQKYDAHSIQARQSGYSKANTWASKRGRVGGFIGRGIAGRIGGANIEAEYSAFRKQQFTQADDQINFGDDTEIRALTALKDQEFEDPNGSGQMGYKTAAGKWVSKASVAQAEAKWGGNHAMRQKALNYEIKKATQESEHEAINNALPTLQRQWGMDDNQMNSTIIGAGFGQQDKNKTYKHTSVENGQVNFAGGKFVDELHAAVGTYQGTAQDAETARDLYDTYATALDASTTAKTPEERAKAQATATKVEEIADQYGGMSTAQIQQYLQTQASQAGVQTTPGASAATAKEIQKLVDTVQMQRQSRAAGTPPPLVVNRGNKNRAIKL